MGAEPALRRKQSLTPLQPAPRAPVAAFGAQDTEGDDVGIAGDQRGSSPQTNEQEVAFSSSGLTSSASADAIAATLAGYEDMGVHHREEYSYSYKSPKDNSSPVVLLYCSVGIMY